MKRTLIAALLCAALIMTGCTAATVRTAVAAPDKSGATVTKTESKTTMELSDDVKIIDSIMAFFVGLW